MIPRTVVVPLDGSPSAEAALEPAVELARGFDAALHLIRATWHRPPDGEVAYLADLAANVDRGGASPAITMSTPIGFAANTVADLLDATTAPLLCMSSRGHTGIGELVLGSVAIDILLRITTPSVLIGPRFRSATATGHDAPIVYCFDDSPAASRLEPTVLEWASGLGRPVHVVTALHRHGAFLGGSPAGEVREAAERLTGRYRAAGLVAEHVIVDGVEPSRVLADHVDESGAALVAAGATRGDPSSVAARMTRTVLGSTSERLVRRATVPVLIGPGAPS